MRPGLLFVLLVGCGNEPRKQDVPRGSAAPAGSELVVFEPSGADFKITARRALPAGYDRFVR